jgi:hypothetical protein
VRGGGWGRQDDVFVIISGEEVMRPCASHHASDSDDAFSWA